MARLTIPDEDTSASFPVTSPTSVFPISFALFEKADLVVSIDDVLLDQSGFTFSGTLLDGGGYQGGTVTLNTAVDDCTVLVRRIVNPLRPSNFGPVTSVPVRAVDMAFNRLTATQQDLRREIGRIQFQGLTGGLDAAGAREAIGADLENIEYQRDAAGAFPAPAVLKLQQTRDLIDFVDRDQWPAIRNFAPSSFATNALGQDSFSAALADMNIDQGGEVRLPDGTVRLQPQTIARAHTHIVGRGSCSVIQSAASTGDMFDYQAPFTVTADLQIFAIVPRTSGAFFRARNEATRFLLENIESHGAFRCLQIDGHVSNPALDSGIFTGKNVKSYETVVNGEAFYIAGGYVVDLEHIFQIGDNSAKALTALRVKRCADLRVSKGFQFLNTIRPILVDPEAALTAASLKIQDGYCGTSLLGSLITDANGGAIASLDMRDVWCGETEQAGAHGLELNGQAGRFKAAKLTAMEFPLALGDGLNANGVKGFQCVNSWADGCAGSGFALQNMAGPQLIGFRSGAERFGGNNVGLFENMNSNMILIGNARGNTTTNFTNGSGTSGQIISVQS